MPRGQQLKEFITDLHANFSTSLPPEDSAAKPPFSHVHLPYHDYWHHHMAMAMISICLYNLEELLNEKSWENFSYRESEFNVLQSIFEAHILNRGQLSNHQGETYTGCLKAAQNLEARFGENKVLDLEGRPHAPFLRIDEDGKVLLNENTYHFVKGLYLGLLKTAGHIDND